MSPRWADQFGNLEDFLRNTNDILGQQLSSAGDLWDVCTGEIEVISEELKT
jgi:hypothetical protein